MSKDPIGLTGGLNEFRFVKNNPVSRADPWGLVDINLLHPSEWLHNEVEKLPSSPKTITLAAHANQHAIYNQNDEPMRAPQVADQIQKLPQYSKDKTVILYACDAGKGSNCFASRLSSCLGGQRVLAADESVWPINGKPVIAPVSPHDENEPDMNKRRKFKVFKK